MIRRLLLGCALLWIAASSFGTPAFFKIFQQKYAGTPAIQNGCANCHLGKPPKRNPYGKAVQSTIENDTITPEGLASIENQDADGDKFSNVEEIKAGTLPGDPASYPGGPVVKVSDSVSRGQGPSTAQEPLIPEHSFHPPIVHFPIALFLFGAFLEAFGRWKKREDVQRAGFWNMLAGIVTGIAAITTGLIASYRLGYGIPPRAPAFNHFLLALIGFGLMGLTLALRKKDARLYLVSLALAAAVIGFAGHLGGVIVFGR